MTEPKANPIAAGAASSVFIAPKPNRPPRTPSQRHAAVGIGAARLATAARAYERECSNSLSSSSEREAARQRLLENALDYARLVQAHFRNR